MTKLTVALIAAVLTVGSTGGVGAALLSGQTAVNRAVVFGYGEPLRGLSAVGVLVETLHDAAEPCGVTREALQLAAARPFLDGGIRLVEEAGLPAGPTATVYVTARVGQLDRGCFAAIDVSLNALTFVALEHQQNEVVALSDPLTLTLVKVILDDQGTVLAGGSSNFGNRVATVVGEYSDRIVTKIKSANQR